MSCPLPRTPRAIPCVVPVSGCACSCRRCSTGPSVPAVPHPVQLQRCPLLAPVFLATPGEMGAHFTLFPFLRADLLVSSTAGEVTEAPVAPGTPGPTRSSPAPRCPAAPGRCRPRDGAAGDRRGVGVAWACPGAWARRPLLCAAVRGTAAPPRRDLSARLT